MFAEKTPTPVRHLARIAAFGFALLLAGAANALSIGDIQLHSRIGEPLRAVVPLGKLGSLAESDILVGRASEEVYRKYGVDHASFNSPLRFSLQVDAKGNGSVAISTEQVVDEPYVDMVMEVRWPTGHAVKQFTLLLDLPAK